MSSSDRKPSPPLDVNSVLAFFNHWGGLPRLVQFKAEAEEAFVKNEIANKAHTSDRKRTRASLDTKSDASSDDSSDASSDAPNTPTSPYKGIHRSTKTGRYEKYLWLDTDEVKQMDRYLEELAPDVWEKKKPRRDGKQIYLGSFKDASAAARMHDRAMILVRGVGRNPKTREEDQAKLNFPYADYQKELDTVWTDIEENKGLVIKMLKAARRLGMEIVSDDFMEIVGRFKSFPGWQLQESRFRGVYIWSGRRNKFVAIIRLNMQSLYLGATITEKGAARLWDKAAFGLLGNQIELNLPEYYTPDELSHVSDKKWKKMKAKDLRAYVKKLALEGPPVEDAGMDARDEEEGELDPKTETLLKAMESTSVF